MRTNFPRETALAKQLLQDLQWVGLSMPGRASRPEFGAWKEKVLALIRRVYGTNSQQEKDFHDKTDYRIRVSFPGQNLERERQQLFEEMLPQAISFMEAIVQDLEMRLPAPREAPAATGQLRAPTVFIAHGGHTHNRDHLELFFWRKGYRPLVVEEMPSLGMGVDAKVDHYLKQSRFAVIFCESDGGSSQDGKLYPRLNVIDELSRVRKTLGDKFIVLLEKGLALPSNEAGALVWESFAPESVDQAFGAVERELKAHGIIGVSE